MFPSCFFAVGYFALSYFPVPGMGGLGGIVLTFVTEVAFGDQITRSGGRA